MHPQEYQFIFGPCEEYPTFESINRLDNNNNNINYNKNTNNINSNNIDMNFNLNNYIILVLNHSILQKYH